MGYLEGLLGGFTSRKRDVELRRQQEEDVAARQEEHVLGLMSNSPDPEIRAHGIAGLFDTASPRKRKGGLRGWLGETQGSPHIEWARTLANAEAARMGDITFSGPDQDHPYITDNWGGPSTSGGQVSTPPGPQPAAQAGTSPTTGGPPPKVEPSLARDVEGQPTATSGGPGVLTGLARDVEGEPVAAPTGFNLQSTGEPSRLAVSPDYGGVSGGAPGVGTPPPGAEAPGVAPQAVLGQAAPGGPAVGQQPVRAGALRRSRQFFQSPEGQIRLNELARTEAGIEGMRNELRAAGFSPDEIKEILKQHLVRRYGGAGALGGIQGFLGEVYNPTTEKRESGSAYLDKQVGSPTFGRWIDANPESATYTMPVGFRRSTTTGSVSLGQWAERAAGELGYPSAAAARAAGPEVMAKVNARAQELQAAAAGATGFARREGTGNAAFQAPIDVKTAQQTNTVVGTSSANYAGQTVASEAEQGRRRGIEMVRGQIEHIKTLLAVLPKKTETQGLAPNLTMAVRRRSPQYRDAAAALETAIGNIQAAMSRTVQENRGATTEGDTERALATITKMQGSLLDPLGGDTQESAAERLAETLGFLDKALATIPGNPVPTQQGTGVGGPPPTSASPGTTAPGGAGASPTGSGSYKDAQGVWHIVRKPQPAPVM